MSAPFIWAAASAGAGLITLALLRAAGSVLPQCLPLGLQKLEHRVLQWRKVEAQANPIEQLQNDYLRRSQRLQSFRQALVTIGGQIESMREKIAKRQYKDPLQVLDKQECAVQRMEHFYQGNLERLRLAHEALEAFRSQVKHKEFECNFAKPGQQVMSALNPHEVEDFMQALLSDEALRSVQARFNTVFAELDVEMCSFNAPTRTTSRGRPWIHWRPSAFTPLYLPQLQGNHHDILDCPALAWQRPEGHHKPEQYRRCPRSAQHDSLNTNWIRTLQALMPLHSNMLHVFTRVEGSRVGSSTVAGTEVPSSGTLKVIRKFSDLKGASVALVGSAQLLGQTLESQLRYGLNFIVADSDAHALIPQVLSVQNLDSPIDHRTVENHIGRIRSQLGIESSNTLQQLLQVYGLL